MGDYASKGLANGLGIPALVLGSLGFLGSGGLSGGLFGNGSAMLAGNAAVASLAEKDAEIGQLKAEKYTNDKLADTYINLNNQINKVASDLANLSLNNERRIGAVECQLNSLATATNNAIAGINATLGLITKTVIPKSAICPEVMERYNSWVAPTATPATTATGA